VEKPNSVIDYGYNNLSMILKKCGKYLREKFLKKFNNIFQKLITLVLGKRTPGFAH